MVKPKRALPIASIGGLTPQQALASSSHLRARKAPQESGKTRIIEVMKGREMGKDVSSVEVERGMLMESLETDFPLLDSTLILTFVLELPTASHPEYATKILELRETLQTFEAGMIPDFHDASIAGSSSQSVLDQSESGSKGAGTSGSISEATKDRIESITSQTGSSSPPSLVEPAASSSTSHKASPAASSAPATVEELLSQLQVSDPRERSSTESWRIEKPKQKGRRVKTEGSEGVESNGDEESLNPETFLMGMFPTLNQEDIERALHHLALAEDYSDLSLAIEDLLSVEAIREAHDGGSWEAEAAEDEGEAAGTEVEASAPTAAVIEHDSEIGEVKSKQDPPLSGSKGKAKAWEGGDARPVPLGTARYASLRPDYVPPRLVRPADISDLKVPGPVRAIKAENKPKPTVPGKKYAELAGAGASSGEESSVERSPRLKKAKPIPWVDTLQRGASPVRRIASPVLREDDFDHDHRTRESLALYLAELINLPKATPTHFLVYLQGAYISGYAAMRAALEAIMAPKSQVAKQIELLEGILQPEEGWEADWQREARGDLGVCVRATDGNVDSAMDLMAKLEEVKDWGQQMAERRKKESSSLPTSAPNSPRLGSATTQPTKEIPELPSFPPSPEQADSYKAKLGKKKGGLEHPQNWRTVVKPKTKVKVYDHPYAESIPSYSRGATPHDPRPGALFASPEIGSSGRAELDRDAYMSRAEEVRERRRDAIRQAGRNFSGGARGKEVAAFYSTQARAYAEEARRWELKAAEELVKTNSTTQDPYCIDVHHLTLVEATHVVRQHVLAWHAAMHFVPSPSKPFTVITGVGNHSVNRVGILLPGLSKVLEREGWKVDRGYSGRGYLVVRGVRS